MSWSLSASGHTPDEQTERELAEKLGEVLRDPRYGTSSVSFGGNHVSGDIR